jgi:hypothetical protein
MLNNDYMKNNIVKITSKTSLLLLVGLATILATGTGQAATVTWSGATSSDWSTGANWTTGFAPTSTDVAQFTSGNATPTLAAGDFTIQRINYTGSVDFNITGAGRAATTLTLDPTSGTGVAFIGSTAGTATSQTFSALTVILNDSNAAGQVKLLPRNGQQFVIASDAKLQIGSTAAQAVILEAQNGSGAGAALTINGVLIGGVAGSSILAENSGVLNLNLAAGSNLENLQLRTGSGGVINFVGGGNFGGSVNPSAGGRVNLATSGITVGSTTSFTFSTGGIIGATYASGTSTLGGQISLATSGTSTFDVASGGTLALDNRVQLGGASAIVEKTGNGTLALTYSVATGNSFTASAFNVRAGTLLVNNTGNTTASAAAVNVFAGATLAGAGRITGATTISGILAPGNSIGTLRVANDVTWNGSLLGGGATTDWQFELGAANAADLLQITGAASEFIKGTGTTFRFDFLGSTDTGIFKLVDWESTASVGGGELGTNFAATDFTYTNLGGGNSGTFRFNGSSLEFQAIPEPSSLVMLIGGGVCLILVRRFGRTGV